MTDDTRKRTVEEIINAKSHDDPVKKEYIDFWKTTAIFYSLIALAYFIFYTIIHATCKPTTFAGWLLGMIFFDVMFTSMMLFSMIGASFKLYNGRSYNTPLGILLRVLCFFDSLVPMMYLVYYFNYDVSTDTCDISIWKIVLLAPVLYGGLLLMGIFMNSKGSYSSNKDANGNDVMTRLDWWNMRREQEIAGIDPDKMPIVLSPSEIKRMTKADWYSLGVDLEMAGYDVFKNRKK